MNKELIKKFYQDSLVKKKAEWGDDVTFFDYEQFAEHILFEVITLIDDTFWSDPHEVYQLREMIEEHFGIGK